MNEQPNTLTPVDKVLRLQSVEVFRHATTEMLAYIGSIAREVRFHRGEVVYKEGDPSDSMYVVLSGRVRLEKEGAEVLLVSESESFGTWALFDIEPRLMTAQAVDDVHLLQINSQDFYDLLSDHEEITPMIFKAVIGRIKTLMPDQRSI